MRSSTTDKTCLRTSEKIGVTYGEASRCCDSVGDVTRISRFDYCNSVLATEPASTTASLQRVYRVFRTQPVFCARPPSSATQSFTRATLAADDIPHHRQHCHSGAPKFFK